MNSLKSIFGSVAGSVAVLLVLSACPAPVPPEPVVPASAVVQSFTVSPAEVEPGGEVTLSWEVKDAKTIAVTTVKGAAAGLPASLSASGTAKVSVETSTVFILTASGEGGGDSAAAGVRIVGQPEPVLMATVPEQVTAGESTVLVWDAPTADQVTITDGAGAQIYSGAEVSGTLVVTPTVSTTYTLTGAGVTASAAVTVSPALLAFAATPAAVHPGDEVVLNWKVGGAESVTLSAEGRGTLLEVTDPARIADGSFTDTVSTTLPTFGVANYTLTARLGTQVVSKSLQVDVGSEPVIKNLIAPEFAKEGGAFTVQWTTAFASRVHLFIDGQQVFTATSPETVVTGSKTFPSPTSPIQLEFRATNDRGGVVSKTVTVSPVAAPSVVSFGATPTVVANGGEVTSLAWQVTNGRHARITDDRGKLIKDVTGLAAASGSVEVYPNRKTVYTLEADNAAGDAVAPVTATVEVTNPARLTFNPSPVPSGAFVQMTGTTVANGGAIRALDFAQKNLPGKTFVDITSTGNVLPFVNATDRGSQLAVFPAPFQTTLFGTPVTATGISVAVDGWFAFSNTAVPGSYQYVPPLMLAGSAELEPLAVVPWSMDLQLGPNSKILWRLDGTGDQRRLIVQWNWVARFGAHATSNLTFQAQVYASGEVVMAYSSFSGLGTYQFGSIGVVNATETGAAQVRADQLANGLHPSAGDTFTFFSTLQPPLTVAALKRLDYTVEQQVGNGAIEITTPSPILDPQHFAIEELNYNPATGKEQWFEVQNHFATPVDLAGWELDFGNDVKHTLTPASGSLVLPANGRLLFGPSADAAEASSGGPAIDYVYGNLALPTTAGYVALRQYNTEYTRSTWSTAGTQGTSNIIQSDPNLVFHWIGAPILTCPGTGTYGSSGQIGSPGGQNALCLKWRMESSTRAFEPIALTGAVVGPLISTVVNAWDQVTHNLDFTALGGRAVKIGTTFYGNTAKPLSVSSSGWVSLVSTTTKNSGNGSQPQPGAPDGTLAIFWDYLASNAGTPTNPSGVFWQQFDPDSSPGTGDEYTLISWEHWRARDNPPYTVVNSSLNFQLRIDEGTGDLEYVYGNMTSDNGIFSNGNNATIWLEAMDGKSAIKYLANEPLLKPNTAIRFRALP